MAKTAPFPEGFRTEDELNDDGTESTVAVLEQGRPEESDDWPRWMSERLWRAGESEPQGYGEHEGGEA